MKEKLKQIKSYSFHVEISNNPGDVFWEQARQMNELWKAMVDIRKDFLKSVERLYCKDIEEEEILKEFRPTVSEFYENMPEEKRSKFCRLN